MKISQKGLYALQAMMMLARHHHQGAIKIREIAYEEDLPEKFLELILLEPAAGFAHHGLGVGDVWESAHANGGLRAPRNHGH